MQSLSTFQGLIFLKVLVFSIFQQLLYSPVAHLFRMKAIAAMKYSSICFLRSNWAKEQNLFDINQDFVSAIKNIFILFFTIFRLAEYIIYKLSDRSYQLHTSLDVQHLKWNMKKNTNKKRMLSFSRIYLPRTNILPISVGDGLKSRFIGPLPSKSLKCFQKKNFLSNNNINRYTVPETKATNAILWQRQRT